MARHPLPIPGRRHALAAAALGAITGFGPAAWAQADAPKAEASAPAPQVVEVTAQGRKQEVLQVPIAIQLIGPEQIQKLGASNIAELTSFTPGLAIDATEPTQPNFSIRGLGTNDFGIGTDSPVGVYVNGVYAGKTGGALTNFNDIKRVEVLKGPQGTLFGRNSAAGAISVITNDPTDRFEASGLVRLGNQATLHTEAMLNQPLGDDLALRFSAVTQRREGWTTNVTTGKGAPQDNAWGSRLALGWNLAGATNALLSWDHEDLDQRPRPVWAVTASTPVFPDAGDYSSFVDPRKQSLHNDPVNGREQRLLNSVMLKIEHDLGFANFSSLTGWRHFGTQNLQDNDGTANIDSHLSTGNFEKNTYWQQEFRLAGNNPTVDWLAGVSFSREKAAQTSQFNTYSNSLDTLFSRNPEVGFPPFVTFDQLALAAGVPQINMMGQTWQEGINNTLDAKAAAVFGDLIWHLSPQTNLTTGIRFTRDEKKFSWHNPPRIAPGLDPQLAAMPPIIQALAAAGAIDPATAAQLEFFANYLLTSNIEFNNPEWVAGPVYRKKSWSNTSPRLVLDHHLDRDTMVFASVTRGYQAGGFNSVSTALHGGTFDPETITNYEIGIKGRLGASGFSYGASLFRYLFKGLQNTSLDHSLAIPAYVVTNSDVQATGVDLEAQWQLSRGLRVYGSAEWIDQKYKSFEGAGDQPDLTGQPFGTPKLSTLALGVDTQWALGGGNASWTLQGSYIGRTRCNDDSAQQGTCLNTPAFEVGEAWTRVDTRLGWEAPSRQWGVGLIVNNLLDTQYVRFLSNLSSVVGSPYYAGLTDQRRIQIEFKAKL
ncbi:MAG TPA: TonB-dependent receptor [Ideonella sp.]|nr:TonB-dependent receptor [Ideonella sp.]